MMPDVYSVIMKVGIGIGIPQDVCGRLVVGGFSCWRWGG